jgi:hypothetical protein
VNEDKRRTTPDSRRRLRIAFVMPPWFDVPPRAYGGIELMAGDLIDALVRRGHDVVMIGAGHNGAQRRIQQREEIHRESCGVSRAASG